MPAKHGFRSIGTIQYPELPKPYWNALKEIMVKYGFTEIRTVMPVLVAVLQWADKEHPGRLQELVKKQVERFTLARN